MSERTTWKFFSMVIRTERAHLSTTGGKVWDAAVTMFDFLKLNIKTSRERPLNVIELGSGCGWLGMSLAEYFGSDLVRVVLTEQECGGGLEWLQHNLDLNPHVSNVEARALDWIEVPDWFTGQEWDLIIGSELVYSPITCELLPKCIKKLASPKSIVYYAHNLNRFESLDVEIVRNFQSCGFEVIPQLANSLPCAISDILFPDMTLEIFSLTLSQKTL